VRSTTAPYTESRLTRSVANERVGFPVVEQYRTMLHSFLYFPDIRPDRLNVVLVRDKVVLSG
jgi:hypothetical protein